MIKCIKGKSDKNHETLTYIYQKCGRMLLFCYIYMYLLLLQAMEKKNLLKKEVGILVEISHHPSYIHCGASTRSQRKKPLNVFNMSFPCCAVVMMMDLLQLELLVHTVKEKRKKNDF